MNKITKRVMTLFGAGVMAVGLLAPVTEVSAASKNQVAEIPVNFTDTGWPEDDEWGKASLTDAGFWDLGEPSSYAESYTASYKLYIPVSFMKEESTVHIGGSLSYGDMSEEEWKDAGWSELPEVELHEDESLTTWDRAQEKDVPVDFASVKKSGDFYVITYKAQNGPVNTENAVSDVTKAEKVAVNFNISVMGINISAENSAVYVDDIQIAKADGTVLANKDFTSEKKVAGASVVAPGQWEKDEKDLKIATITDNKVLNVKATKATVKVGKTKKISATATPATKITYKSSNKKIATVNAKGVITGKKAGKATISVKANGKTVKVKVTVKK